LTWPTWIKQRRIPYRLRRIWRQLRWIKMTRCITAPVMPRTKVTYLARLPSVDQVQPKCRRMHRRPKVFQEISNKITIRGRSTYRWPSSSSNSYISNNNKWWWIIGPNMARLIRAWRLPSRSMHRQHPRSECNLPNDGLARLQRVAWARLVPTNYTLLTCQVAHRSLKSLTAALLQPLERREVNNSFLDSTMIK